MEKEEEEEAEEGSFLIKLIKSDSRRDGEEKKEEGGGILLSFFLFLPSSRCLFCRWKTAEEGEELGRIRFLSCLALATQSQDR